ncbi:putative aarF domain-containing protein kinase chloroplastic-like [Trifolium medium]|uniref:Putative aarF domain-containing protein kinase chloroplastic-like n=1 Tax=Trifolium medium TaxID=97028 RepID=A0A392PEX1_9FABA|nr:putative aarF domain-containing protein kinase chloroplastic-like [Trifolium medium]
MDSFFVNSLYTVSPQLTISPRIKQNHVRRVRISSLAATTGNSAKNGAVLRPLQLPSNSRSNNSALEQLDIERGVCIPFRKYSPESVWFLAFLVAFCSLF